MTLEVVDGADSGGSVEKTVASGRFEGSYDPTTKTAIINDIGGVDYHMTVDEGTNVNGFKTTTITNTADLPEGTTYKTYIYEYTDSTNSADYLAFGVSNNDEALTAGYAYDFTDTEAILSRSIWEQINTPGASFSGLPTVIVSSDGSNITETATTGEIIFNQAGNSYSGSFGENDLVTIEGSFDGNWMQGTSQSGDMSGLSNGYIGYGTIGWGTLGAFSGDNGEDSAFAGGWQGAGFIN